MMKFHTGKNMFSYWIYCCWCILLQMVKIISRQDDGTPRLVQSMGLLSLFVNQLKRTSMNEAFLSFSAGWQMMKFVDLSMLDFDDRLIWSIGHLSTQWRLDQQILVKQFLCWQMISQYAFCWSPCYLVIYIYIRMYVYIYILSIPMFPCFRSNSLDIHVCVYCSII